MSISIVTNEDNLQMMGRYPDKFFDLAVVDPPYGIGISKTKGYSSVKNRYTIYKAKQWDNKIPDDDYFKDLFRVSKKQIIFGGNYFNLPLSPNWIIWDKLQPEGNDFAKYELAWNSSELKGKIYRKSSSYNNGGNSSNSHVKISKARIHPTQKPVSLYTWILQNYAKQDDKILDTHLGSGSCRIAAYDLGFDFYGCEKDKEYFDASCKRFNTHIAQQKLFAPTNTHAEQITLL